MELINKIEYIPDPKPTTTIDRNGNEHEFTQLYDHFPQIEFLYTQFEKDFRSDMLTKWCDDNWWLPLTLISLYCVMIYAGPIVMKDRKKFDWKYPLALWNAGLSLFSFMGVLRTVPHLLHNLYRFNFDDNICQNAAETYGHGACGFWVMLFIFSKIPELIDTVFIVFRKSKLIFLHWYHHITVLAFCWHAYATESSTGIFFVAMNYTVHAIMYCYFCCNGLKLVPKWFPSHYITIAQISQMVVGTYICVASFQRLNSGQECSVKKENVIAGALMYGSYLYLFCEFFVNAFIFKKKGKKDENKEAEKIVLTKEDKKAINEDEKGAKGF